MVTFVPTPRSAATSSLGAAKPAAEPSPSTPDRADVDVSATAEQLLGRRAKLQLHDPRRAALRAQAIQSTLPVARRLARRYVGCGETLEDLFQVASLGLVKAVDGFDPSREIAFVTYALPSIVGALKRHFRGTSWGLRPPRGLQELVLALRSASDDLGHLFGRPPTSAELAKSLDITPKHLVAVQAAALAYRPESLDAPVKLGDTSDGGNLARTLSHIDPGYAAVDNRLMLQAALDELPERDRRIVSMRFYGEMTQTQIAVELGVSQMQVSRLLRQCLNRLQIAITRSPAGPAASAGGTSSSVVDTRPAHLGIPSAPRGARAAGAPAATSSGHRVNAEGFPELSNVRP